MDRSDGSAPALSTDLDTWHRVQETNLTTVFLCCKHGIKHLQGTQPSGGAVVNAASLLADIGAATAQMGYAAAKAAVVQFSRDLAIHLAPQRRARQRSIVRPDRYSDTACSVRAQSRSTE